MSADSLVFWIFAAAWIVVAGLLLFVRLPQIVREAGRIVRRVIALIEQPVLAGQIAKAEADLGRIRGALMGLEPLRRRALKAADRLRSARPLPQSMVLVVGRIERELRRLREAASR